MVSWRASGLVSPTVRQEPAPAGSLKQLVHWFSLKGEGWKNVSSLRFHWPWEKLFQGSEHLSHSNMFEGESIHLHHDGGHWESSPGLAEPLTGTAVTNKVACSVLGQKRKPEEQVGKGK